MEYFLCPTYDCHFVLQSADTPDSTDTVETTDLEKFHLQIRTSSFPHIL